jgi:hypothetical protein
MAKRQRTRPGRRPQSSQRSRPTTAPTTASAASTRPAGSLSPAEEARAAELEAEIVAEERAATAVRERGRERRRAETSGSAAGRGRDSAPIELRAEQEYAYVVRDVRRIVRVGGSLLIVLAVLFVLIDVTGVIRL